MVGGNRILNPHLEINVSNLGAYGGAVQSRETGIPITGLGSLKTVTPGSAVREGSSFLTATGMGIPAGRAFVGGFSAKGAGQMDCWMRISNTDATLTESAVQTVVLTGSTVLIAFSALPVGAGKVGDNAELMCRTDDGVAAQAVTFYLDDAYIYIEAYGAFQ